jgi:uncharacterized protein (TIGR02996 family)
MMEQAFLRDILEQPDDDVARLAYADWLLEQDDPASAARGEFIQIQCRLARRGEGSAGWDQWSEETAVLAARPHLEAREKELLAAHGASWAQPVRALVEHYEFRRGFVARVALSGPNFLKNAAELFQRAPVQEVRLTGLNPVVRSVAQVPELGRVSALDLSRCYLGSAGVRLLLASPYLRRLRILDLSQNMVGLPGVQALAASPYLAQLTALNLGNNHLNMETVRILTGSPYWGSVQTLNLQGNAAIDAQAREFLTGALVGEPDPVLLSSVLRKISDQPEREYSNAHVRALVERARANPEQAVAVLNEGLRDSRRKVRAAAAQFLSRLGQSAEPSLPGLVQRLHEHNANVRGNVGPALARLLPGLPDGLQEWLCVLANPLVGPMANLRAALESPRLPESVRQGLAEVCARRARWWAGITGHGELQAPSPAHEPSDRRSVWEVYTPHSEAQIRRPQSLWEAAQDLASLAEQAAVRHLSPGQQESRRREAARGKEYAWLLARLCELLQAAPLPPSSPRSGSMLGCWPGCASC